MIKLYVCEISNLIEEIKADKKALDSYLAKLGEKRIEYILKKSRAEDRARAIGASYLLLFALKQEGYKPETLPDYAYTQNGKPYLEELSQMYFNISHTKNIITCVISDREVGVDVEHVREIKETTINRVFSEKERQMAENSVDGYVQLWTMKEACAKCIGTGISEIVAGLEIVKKEEKTEVRKLNQDIIKTFCYIVLAEGKVLDSRGVPYYYSVCAEQTDKVLEIHTRWDEHQIFLC